MESPQPMAGNGVPFIDPCGKKKSWNTGGRRSFWLRAQLRNLPLYRTKPAPRSPQLSSLLLGRPGAGSARLGPGDTMGCACVCPGPAILQAPLFPSSIFTDLRFPSKRLPSLPAFAAPLPFLTVSLELWEPHRTQEAGRGGWRSRASGRVTSGQLGAAFPEQQPGLSFAGGSRRKVGFARRAALTLRPGLSRLPPRSAPLPAAARCIRLGVRAISGASRAFLKPRPSAAASSSGRSAGKTAEPAPAASVLGCPAPFWAPGSRSCDPNSPPTKQLSSRGAPRAATGVGPHQPAAPPPGPAPPSLPRPEAPAEWASKRAVGGLVGAAAAMEPGAAGPVGGGAPAFSPEWMACLLAEAEALLAERVSAPVRARWRREVKLPRMSLEGCLEQLSEARRGREALLARAGPLSEAKQDRLQTFLRLEMALLREMQALRERALASAFAIAKKGEPPPAPAGRGREEGGGEARRPGSPAREEGGGAAGGPRVVSAAEAASQAKAAAQREALAEALWEPGGVGDLIAKSGDLQLALEQLVGERLGEALRGLERAVRGEGRARVRQLLAVRDALLEQKGGWAERAGTLRGEARALRGAGRPGALREKAAALRDCLAEAPLEELRPALEKAVALLEKTDSWWVAWLEKALWAAPLEEAEAARREAQALSAALQPQPPVEEGEEEGAVGLLLCSLESEGSEASASASPRWGSLEEMRDALQSAPFDEVFALLKQPRALRQALQESSEVEEQGELPAVLGTLEEAFGRARPGDWREQLSALRGGRWEDEAVALLEKVWALKTEVFLLASDLDREEKVAALVEELQALHEAAAAAPLGDRETLREKLAVLQAALHALPVQEVLLLRAKAKALRKAATDFWTEPLAEADALLAEADALQETLARSALREALWAKAEELRGALREIAKKKISVLSYYLWNVLWSPLWKKVGDMQRALWKTPRKEEGAVQEKLADLEHALDEILEDNLSGLPRILYALPGIVTALQKKVHAVRESLQEMPPEMAVALQGKVVAMQEALWKIPFKEAHLMQEDLKAYCLALQRKVEAWWAQPLEAAPAKVPPRMERQDTGWTRRGAPEPVAAPGDAEVGGTRQPGVSSPALPATPGAPNPPTGEVAPAVGPGRFQYSALKAIPHSHFQQRKDWYENTDQDLRDYVVQRLVHAIFPAPDLAVLKDHQVEKVVSYGKKVEGDVYQSTNHWDVYCCLIMVKLFKIEKELREKRTFRGHKQGTADDQASPVGPTQPAVLLNDFSRTTEEVEQGCVFLLTGSQLGAPEVPLSPTQDPPGVSQLNPMSIWTIQNSPTSLDTPAASPTNPPAQTHDEGAALTMAASPPWMPQPQSAMRASSGTISSPPSAPGQFLPPHLFPAPLGVLDTSGGILAESGLQGGVQGLDPGSPLSYSAPTVAPLPPHALPGAQSESASLGPMTGAAPGLSPEAPPQQQPPPPCPKSAPGPGTLGDPHFGTREASSHGLLGKRRRLADGAWRASPAGSSPSALPDASAQPSPVTLESLQRSLEDLRISVLRNLGAVHRQVEALEKRIHTLERWRAETEGRQQLPQP
ncbi:uncharacterized protein LOC131192645 isoform X2 [Ahaetulla prasina]|uniref:uncharacterized protein LOC131192645 isoform X2 n=1 Tax=Ahaetulla prasina TaxID=499056 RepID=UPI002649C75E|nr:uncharacterized protein LOC131192645 isoform X2 [Ahaetulla prasina]